MPESDIAKLAAVSYNVDDKNNFNMIDDDVKQIIYGSLLGAGYICKGKKNDFFSIRHSQKHDLWLKAKASELTEFACPTPFNKYHNTLTWRSTSHPFFTELKKEFYDEDGKKITMEWMDRLRDLAIVVWFGDSGCMTGRGNKNACLRTQSFGLEGNQIIERYFNEVNIPCSINKSRKSYVIVFSIEGTRKLFKLIANSPVSPKITEMLPFQNVK